MEAGEPNSELGSLLEVVRSVFEQSGEWPSRQYVQAVLDQDHYVDLDEALAGAPRGLLRTSGSQRDAEVILTVRGLQASGAEAEVGRFVEALRWCVDEVRGFRPTDPGKAEDLELSSDQFADEWRSRGRTVSDLDLTKLRAMVATEGVFDWLSGEGASWSMRVSYDGLRPFRQVNSVADYLQLVEAREFPAEPVSPLVSEPSLLQITDVRVAAVSAVSVEGLAPPVRAACTPLFESGHYAQGVLEAVKAMRDLIREVSGLSGDGDSLVGRAFGGANPAVELADLEDETGQNIQRGVLLMSQGVFAAIRNPLAHERRELDPTQAVEMAAMISFVVRAIESRPGAGSALG